MVQLTILLNLFNPQFIMKKFLSLLAGIVLSATTLFGQSFVTPIKQLRTDTLYLNTEKYSAADPMTRMSEVIDSIMFHKVDTTSLRNDINVNAADITTVEGTLVTHNSRIDVTEDSVTNYNTRITSLDAIIAALKLEMYDSIAALRADIGSSTPVDPPSGGEAVTADSLLIGTQRDLLLAQEAWIHENSVANDQVSWIQFNPDSLRFHDTAYITGSPSYFMYRDTSGLFTMDGNFLELSSVSGLQTNVDYWVTVGVQVDNIWDTAGVIVNSIDADSILYVDLDAGTNGSGSFASPFNTPITSMTGGKYYFYKRGSAHETIGTTITMAQKSAMIAYGQGGRPRIKMTDTDADGYGILANVNDVIVSGIELDLNGNVSRAIELGSNADISNVKILGCRIDSADIGIWCDNIISNSLIANNTITQSGTDAMYLLAEYTKIQGNVINTVERGGTGQGDGVQLTLTNYRNYIGHNWIKFGDNASDKSIILSRAEYDSDGNVNAWYGDTTYAVIEHNTLYSSTDIGSGINVIGLYDTVRYNYVYNTFNFINGEPGIKTVLGTTLVHHNIVEGWYKGVEIDNNNGNKTIVANNIIEDCNYHVDAEVSVYDLDIYNNILLTRGSRYYRLNATSGTINADYNLFYESGDAYVYLQIDDNSSAYATLANAQSAGYETNSIQESPEFDSLYVPINAGNLVDAGTSVTNVTRDFLGNIITGTPDMGIIEYGATPVAQVPVLNGDELIFSDAAGFGTESLGAYELYSNTLLETDLPDILIVDTLYAGNLNTGTNRGSFEWALKQTTPRIITFEVGGVIDYTSTNVRQIKVNNGYINVYGQTAPSPGITLLGAELYWGSEADHALMQHIAVRFGDHIRPDGNVSQPDALALESGFDYGVFDHCSFSWSQDEIIGSPNSDNITISNSMIYHPLHFSYHVDEGSPNNPERHGFAALVYGGNNWTFYNNFIGWAADRVPRIDIPNIVWINNYTKYYGADPSYFIGDPSAQWVVAGNNLYPTPGRASNDRIWNIMSVASGYDAGITLILTDDQGCINCDNGDTGYDIVYPGSTTLTQFNAIYDNNIANSPFDLTAYDILAADSVLNHQKAFIGMRPWDRDFYDSVAWTLLDADTIDWINSPYPEPAKAYNKAIYSEQNGYWTPQYGTAGDMRNGYDFSSNNVSFTINGSTVNLTTNCVDQAAVISAISPQLPSGVEVIDHPNSLSYHLIFQTTATGADQEIILSGDASVFGIPNGTYTGSNHPYGGEPTIASTKYSLDIPANPHYDDDADGYTNIQEWVAALQPTN
jgi:hypothetical protein